MKRKTKMQHLRLQARIAARGRGVDQTSHKRSPLRGLMAQLRHCHRYLAFCRRKGWLPEAQSMAAEG